MRWLRGAADLNSQGSGTAAVRVAAPGLYRVRSAASARRARDAYVEVTDSGGALHATVLWVDEEVPRTTGPVLQVLEERFGITSARAERAAQRRDAADVLADQLNAGCVHVALPHAALTVEELVVPPLQAVSDEQLGYARAVRASAVHRFLSAMLARGAKLPCSNVEEQMPMLAGWVRSHLRVKTESRYWLDGPARADPSGGVLGEAFREA